MIYLLQILKALHHSYHNDLLVLIDGIQTEEDFEQFIMELWDNGIEITLHQSVYLKRVIDNGTYRSAFKLAGGM